MSYIEFLITMLIVAMVLNLIIQSKRFRLIEKMIDRIDERNRNGCNYGKSKSHHPCIEFGSNHLE